MTDLNCWCRINIIFVGQIFNVVHAMIRVKICLLLSLLLLVTPLMAQQENKAHVFYEEAMDFLSRQEDPISKDSIQVAIGLYKKAIATDENFSLAYEQLASEYWSLGKFKEGMAIIDEGIAKNKEVASFYLVKGMLLEDSQKVIEAKELYKKAQQLYNKQYKPKKLMSFEDVFNYALTYYLLENQDAAIAKFESICEKGAFTKDDHEYYYPLGIDTLSDMEIMDYIEQSITNKYGLR